MYLFCYVFLEYDVILKNMFSFHSVAELVQSRLLPIEK